MSLCKPVNEIVELGTKWVPKEFVEMYGKDYTFADYALLVRNGEIYSFFYDPEIPEGRKIELANLAGEMTELLAVNGFLRPDIVHLSNPEAYFVMEYVVGSGIVNNDNVEIFAPYYSSNYDYENYVFEYERIEEIIDQMSNYLTEKEHSIFKKNVMLMEENSINKREVIGIKSKIRAKKEMFAEIFERAFAMH